MRKTIIKTRVFIVLLVLAVFIPFIHAAPAPNDEVTLTIIHINDRHGRMAADPYISQLANEMNGNVLILDAGDALHGQTTTNITKGTAMVELMNAVGYSAMAAGNHEFDYGVERLIELSEMMDFPLLAANIKTSDGNLLLQQYEIFPMDKVTVGVFGLATPETVAVSDPRNIAGLTFEDPVQTAQAMVAALKAEGCEIIIALTHMGVDDLSLAANRSDALSAIDGIDVIIDGHSHTKLDNGLWIGNTLIAQTGEHGQHIGIVEITISGDTVTKSARLIKVSDELAADGQILRTIARLDAANEDIIRTVIGHTPVFLDGARENVRAGETNLANLITDSMRHGTGADIVFFNGGGIRDSIPAGDITMEHVLNVLPYSNLIVTVELTGAEILEAVEHGVSMYPDPVGQYIQISGAYFEFDPAAEAGNRVKKAAMADGSAFDINKTYTVATIEFIAVGGDGYTMMANRATLVYYGGDAEIFADYLATNPNIKAEPEDRVRLFAGYIESENSINPKTGDDKNIAVWLWICGAGILGLVIVVSVRLYSYAHSSSKKHGVE